MKTLAGILFALLLLADPVQAQVAAVIDLNKAEVSWNWNQGDGADATEFRLKCGTQTGQWPNVSRIVDPAARVVSLRLVIGGSGAYYCVIVAANEVGESPPSNEVFFVAKVAPSGSITLTIK